MFSGERVLVPILDELYTRLAAAEATVERLGRPMFTVAYAQSLDGSIAGERNRPIALSCGHSWQLTHEIRAAHDAILVGIGTVVADNPRLTVRLVRGTDPRPIVVDSLLRLPREAHLLNEDRKPWVATTERAGNESEAALRSRGADVLRLPALDNGWVNLEALAGCLADLGVAHVLVEGGSRILTSFLKARLVDYVVVTVSPQFVGGVAALARNELSPFPRLRSWRTERIGDDLVVAGELEFSDE
ncbi:MAG TPA: dihydrofolate reductase family protein [Vicinamibacteria bacterium]|nr:dihydrofolate reductase family protein [Vicinamibacteria bacterium]